MTSREEVVQLFLGSAIGRFVLSAEVKVFIAIRDHVWACGSDFWYRWRMEPTEEQLTALGNYRDIIIQHASKIADAIGVSPETLTGWTEDNGEFTSEQADKILEFLRKETKRPSERSILSKESPARGSRFLKLKKTSKLAQERSPLSQGASGPKREAM
jgi:hypothetical protein